MYLLISYIPILSDIAKYKQYQTNSPIDYV